LTLEAISSVAVYCMSHINFVFKYTDNYNYLMENIKSYRADSKFKKLDMFMTYVLFCAENN